MVGYVHIANIEKSKDNFILSARNYVIKVWEEKDIEPTIECMESLNSVLIGRLNTQEQLTLKEIKDLVENINTRIKELKKLKSDV